MASRKPLECIECGCKTITRSALGRGNYQEFAFPCPGCGIEIRFGMNLYPDEARWDYDKIVISAVETSSRRKYLTLV